MGTREREDLRLIRELEQELATCEDPAEERDIRDKIALVRELNAPGWWQAVEESQ